ARAADLKNAPMPPAARPAREAAEDVAAGDDEARELPVPNRSTRVSIGDLGGACALAAGGAETATGGVGDPASWRRPGLGPRPGAEDRVVQFTSTGRHG